MPTPRAEGPCGPSRTARRDPPCPVSRHLPGRFAVRNAHHQSRFPRLPIPSDPRPPLADSTGNGRPDAGPLPPGGTVDIVLRITVPVNIPTGQVDNTTILAVSANTPAVRGSVTNLATIPNIWDPLAQTVTPTGQVLPGETA